MAQNNTPFDVAIIGSGIAGSILGAILARNGPELANPIDEAEVDWAVAEIK